MYGVFIPDADALRRVLDRPKTMLGHPYCGYLIYLARSVDGPAVRFLEKFGAAVDVETSEALAFLVLLDRAVLHGRNDPSGRLHTGSRTVSRRPPARGGPTIELPETTSGGREVTQAVAKRFGTGSIPAAAFYQADPQWSLKFAAHLGLSRSYLPCIVAMDDPAASDDDSCAVISLADEETAWSTLKDAIATYVAEPGTQAFLRAAERAREAADAVAGREQDLRNARRSVEVLERLEHADDMSSAVRRGIAGLGRADRILARFPSAPREVFGWAAKLTEDDRHTVAAAALRAGGDHLGTDTLRALLTDPELASAARTFHVTVRRLSKTWLLEPVTDNPHLATMMADALTAALSHLDRSPDDLPRLVGLTDRADREAFLELLASRAPLADAELDDHWRHLDGAVRAQIPGVVRDEQLIVRQAELRAAEQDLDEAVAAREAAEVTLKATPMSAFVPHLARADAGTRTGGRASAGDREGPPSRTAIATGGTAFLADVVQILQGLGALQ